MNPFHDYSFKWWQVSILKFAVLLFGIAIGAYWADFFNDLLVFIIVLAVVLGAYSWYVALRQK